MASRAAPSLMQRAVAALARREYSRAELARKLAPHASSPDQLETLLESLAAKNLLSNPRFAQSLAHRRQERYGARRIAMELGQHELAPELIEAVVSELGDSEFARCKSVWEKKFSVLPTDLHERARQTRFLLGRGFDSRVIAQILKGRAE